ncbi:primosomal protein N' [Corynebacterium liangguodongii]|uniref:Probable replication restart protein PriA n=1 Tax=Corynebacterium liangguodongii TaxID=2079535 RepID=A0A2S0WE99_9CORY|nr:primosomal protein N' [Corynebacterium liangguodongii]AWB84070.1 primosome assembly protein PriA [Corynebacterium liangguodongii]PWC00081.1 primosomal protein N' [Corynebacterium liangguodongii]
MPETPSAAKLPVARVLPLLGLAHLDRPFDYLVAERDSAAAVAGVKVRIRFAGRLVDALVLERRETTEHAGALRYIERVISPEVVAPERLRLLVDSLCERYAGIRSDIYRAAIPPRHAKAEETDTTTAWEELGDLTEPDLSDWMVYEHGSSFADSVIDGRLARAAWQIAPGHDWARPVAALAAKVAQGGGGVLIVVPDQRDLDRCGAALRDHVGARHITTLTASQGPQARYSRFLSILHGQARIVLGTRSAAFAPVEGLRLIVLMHDGDDSLVDPRAPYVHAREVLTTRSAQEKASLLLGGHSRSTEAQLLVESGWMHELAAPRDMLRRRAPRIHAAGDTDVALERDPRARQARIPSVAFQAATRALEGGRPVLVQVPRGGYVQALACGQCRTPARCRWCNGPLALPSGGGAAAPTCRWCGRMDAEHRCPACGSRRLRAVVIGTERTAEELGRAFAKYRVRTSWGERIIDAVDNAPAVVVATPGAEPRVRDGSYGAAILLDTWALLERPDLRASEEALERWMAAATLVAPASRGGEVVVVADPAHPTVQHLIRWDPAGHAARELAQRRDARFPPAVHVAVVDAPRAALEDFFSHAELPAHAELLGPVDLPPGVELPGQWDEVAHGPAQRVLVRSPLAGRAALGRALRAAAVSRAARKQDQPLRIQVDPLQIG